MELCHEPVHKRFWLPTQRPQPASVPAKMEINMEPWTQYERQHKDFPLFLAVHPHLVFTAYLLSAKHP